MAYYSFDPKWGLYGAGTSGGVVTWHLATYTDSFNDFSHSIGDYAQQALVRDAFDAWEAVLDIDFLEVSAQTDADIEVAYGYIDGAGGTLGETETRYSSSNGYQNTYTRAAVRMDVEEYWTSDKSFDGNYVGDPENFYAVVLHEIGHAIGIDHLSDYNTIMYAYAHGIHDLTAADIAAGAEIYGLRPTGGTQSSSDGILGGSGGDTLRGGGGSDVIKGYGGADKLYGLGGADRLFGGSGQDLLKGGGGADKLAGGSGADRLVGGDGRDVMQGGGGADKLLGGRGDDVLKGGAGNDRLEGGGGADRLAGGAGADVFVLTKGAGRDVIQDFQDGVDRIWAKSFDEVSVERRGDDTLVHFDGFTALIKNVDMDDLSAADFFL